jgi:L-lactate dehydrogenase complex protein LldG
MTGRDAILTSLRRAAPPAVSHPRNPDAMEFPDPVQKFAEVLAGVGGKCVRGELREMELFKNAKRIVSCLDGFEQPERAKDLAGVDLAIVRGEFGVAENAAVWVPSENLGRHRALFVIAEHLILLVPANAILHNMRQAYERIRIAPGRFGVFISGPSKTADIEQALVIGAQGPRSCTVLLVD